MVLRWKVSAPQTSIFLFMNCETMRGEEGRREEGGGMREKREEGRREEE